MHYSKKNYQYYEQYRSRNMFVSGKQSYEQIPFGAIIDTCIDCLFCVYKLAKITELTLSLGNRDLILDRILESINYILKYKSDLIDIL